MIELNLEEAAALADLHLDDGSKKGQFTPHKDRLLRFLDYWGNKPLFYLGDFQDQWLYRPARIISAHADIHEEAWRHKRWLLKGNHSPDMDPLRDVFEDRIAWVIRLNGWYLTHGHLYDPVMDSPLELWGAKWAAKGYQLISNPLLDPIRDWVLSGHRQNIPILYKLRKTGVSPWAIGHSHVMGYGRDLETGFEWANPGAVINDRMYYLHWRGRNLTIKEWV